MSSLRMILLPLVCLMLSACTQYVNQYLERKDTITLGAGDAVASNAAVQIPTPWPRYSNDTNIAFDGEKIGCAVQRYRDAGSTPQASSSGYGPTGGGGSVQSSSGAGCPPSYGAGAPSGPAPAP